MAEVHLDTVEMSPEAEEGSGIQNLTVPKVDLPKQTEFAPEFSSENIDRLVDLEREKQEPGFTKSFARLKQQLAHAGGLQGTPFAQLGAEQLGQQETSIAGYRQGLMFEGLKAQREERTDQIGFERDIAKLIQQQAGNLQIQVRQEKHETGLQEDIQAHQTDILSQTQTFTAEQAKLSRQFQATESLLGREWSTSERKAIQEWNDLNREDQQSWESAEKKLDRSLTTTERQAIQLFQETQNDLNRRFELAMQDDRQEYASAEKTGDRNFDRATNMINQIANGMYKPSKTDLEFLENQGFSGEFTDKVTIQYGVDDDGNKFDSVEAAELFWQGKGAKMDLLSVYGVDDKGEPFKSEQAAIKFWDDKGFDGKLAQMYGLDPITKLPFKSQAEAQAHWENEGVSSRLNQMYGMKTIKGSDGRVSQVPFSSESEARTYWENKAVEMKYGKKEDGKDFSSVAEAEAYWKDKGADSALLKKYGTRNTVNGPVAFTSAAEAETYWEGKGYNKELVRKFGVKGNGEPFTSEYEATQYRENEAFQKQLMNIKDVGVRDAIGDIGELEYFFEFGRTYEDEAAQIIADAKTLDDWRDKLPKLEDTLVKFQKQLDNEVGKNSGWVEAIFGGGRDQGKVDGYKEKVEGLKAIIADVRAGKIPIVEWDIDALTKQAEPPKPLSAYV